MRLLFVVQRYGEEIAGGSEAAGRMFAEKMAERGHDVEVLTSCALRYLDWANHFRPGTSVIRGVRVHRLRVAHGRASVAFDAFQRVIHGGPGPHPLALQEAWLRSEGPVLEGIEDWCIANAGRFDAVIVLTYLYPPAYAAITATAGRAPVVFMPTAHRELYLDLPIFDTPFALADGFAFLTPEEATLVDQRFVLGDRPAAVVGIGIDLPDRVDPSAFRAAYRLGDDPYLLCLGRIDAGKGAGLLHDYVVAYRARRRSDLRLVYVGEQVTPLPERDDVVCTGFVDDVTKQQALAGAFALVQPSFFESFSLVLCESWAHLRPVLVNEACEVLAAQTKRARGGFLFTRYATFEAALAELEATDGLAGELGRSGRRYVEAEYQWPVVLGRLESVVTATIEHAAGRWGSGERSAR